MLRIIRLSSQYIHVQMLYIVMYAGLSKAVLATAVTVPLVVLLLIAAVIVIVAGVYWARQRPNQHYNFRHVTMSQVQEC